MGTRVHWSPFDVHFLFMNHAQTFIFLKTNMKISHLTQATPCPPFAATLPSLPPASTPHPRLPEQPLWRPAWRPSRPGSQRAVPAGRPSRVAARLPQQLCGSRDFHCLLCPQPLTRTVPPTARETVQTRLHGATTSPRQKGCH